LLVGGVRLLRRTNDEGEEEEEGRKLFNKPSSLLWFAVLPFLALGGRVRDD